MVYLAQPTADFNIVAMELSSREKNAMGATLVARAVLPSDSIQAL